MLPAVGVVHGDVAQEFYPRFLESARNTIRGTVKVAVRVDVTGQVMWKVRSSNRTGRANISRARHWRPRNFGDSNRPWSVAGRVEYLDAAI